MGKIGSHLASLWLVVGRAGNGPSLYGQVGSGPSGQWQVGSGPSGQAGKRAVGRVAEQLEGL